MRSEAAGVDVTVVMEPGTRHGHVNEPDQPGGVTQHRAGRHLATRPHHSGGSLVT